MRILLSGAWASTADGIKKADVIIDNGVVFGIYGPGEAPDIDIDRVIRWDNFFITPGFVDVHVHLREPGFSYKETIATGTKAAYVSGYRAVMPMPNLKPAPFNMENLKIELDIIERDAKVLTIPYGRITKDGRQLADMEEMAPYVCGFSDDGQGVQGSDVMKKAMLKAKELGKIISAHCEDERFNTYEPASEFAQVERDIDLAKETGCAYHVCHISTKESVDLIRAAKADGIDVTCETGPHYLVLNNEHLPNEGRFKMNPPIRTERDREALVEGFRDGTIDCLATDHAPHSKEEKSGTFMTSLFGITGLETAFPVMNTFFGDDEEMFARTIDAMCVRPARRFGLGGGYIEAGMKADLTVIDREAEFRINSMKFVSMGKATPFDRMMAKGRVVKLIRGENIIDL